MTYKVRSKAAVLLERAASSDYAQLDDLAIVEGTWARSIGRVARAALTAAVKCGGNWREVRAEAAQMLREGWTP